MVLLQLEVPLDAVIGVARFAQGIVILNPAPPQRLPAELFRRIDVLVPNRAELGCLAEGRTSTLEEVAAAAHALKEPGAIVVTLGQDGFLVVGDGYTEVIPAVSVDVVDTTAAGDCFCGAMADALVRGDQLRGAAVWASRAAAVSVTRMDAQASLPNRNEVEALLA